MNKNSMVYTVVFTFLVAFLFVLILSFTYEGTKDLVEKNQEVRIRKAFLQAMGISFSTGKDIFTSFDNLNEKSIADTTLYTTIKGSETIVAKQYAGSGLWGTIKGVLAVNKNLSKIIGFEIISQNETPGLGGRIDESWFKSQFENLPLSPEKNISVIMGSAEEAPKADKAHIDGITGATSTSKAIEKIINTQLETFETLLEDYNE